MDIKIKASAIMLAMCVVISQSCDKGLLTGRFDSHIEANVHAVSGVGTKASDGPVLKRTIALDDNYVLLEYESDIEDGAPETKGITCTSANLGQVHPEFSVDAFLGSGREEPSHFIDSGKMSYDGTGWKWVGDAPQWRNEVTTMFWSVSTASDEFIPEFPSEDVSENELRQMSFCYAVPVDARKNSFKSQDDLLLAFNEESRSFDADRGTSRDGKPNTIDILFHHALSAVRFSVDDALSRDITDIESVSIGGLKGEGRCLAEGSGSDVAFSWTPYGEDVTYEQMTDKADLKNDITTLFAIPQDLATAELKVVFVKHGIRVRKTVSLAGPSASWLPGKRYTYVLKSIVHVPGEEITLNESMAFKGFKNGVPTIASEKSYEVVGVKKIGIVLNQYLKNSSGFGQAEYYLVSEDGSKDSRNSTVSFDFLPLPAYEQWPYAGGDGTPETYLGLQQTKSAQAGDDYVVFDVTGYRSFRLVCHVSSSANDARWNVLFKKIYILEVENKID